MVVVVLLRSACGRDGCLVHSGNNVSKRRPGGRPILLVYNSGCSEPLQTCFATNEAKHVALPSVQIDPVDTSRVASVSGRVLWANRRGSPACAPASTSTGFPGMSLSPYITAASATLGMAA
jgi:hypothetical protein